MNLARVNLDLVGVWSLQQNLKTSELPGWDFIPKSCVWFPGAGTGHRVSCLVLGRCPAELEAFQCKADSSTLKGNILLELHNLRALPLAPACMCLSQHRGLRSAQKEKIKAETITVLSSRERGGI